MINSNSAKIIFIIGCGLTLIIGFLLLDAFIIHSTYVLVGVFREMITLPSLFALPILLVINLNQWHKEKFKLNSLLFWSFLMLLITLTAVIVATVSDYN